MKGWLPQKDVDLANAERVDQADSAACILDRINYPDGSEPDAGGGQHQRGIVTRSGYAHKGKERLGLNSEFCDDTIIIAFRDPGTPINPNTLNSYQRAAKPSRPVNRSKQELQKNILGPIRD